MKQKSIICTLVFLLTLIIGCSNDTTPGNDNVVTSIKLPKTGMTATAHIGDDGDLQKGVAWPVPRFIDNGDGTITDKLTGLMWEKTPSTATYTWENAFAVRITGLNNSALGGHKDWRLPNILELESLINLGQAYPAAWLNTQGFVGITNARYWSSTTYANTNYGSCALRIGMAVQHEGNGIVHISLKNSSQYVLCLRGNSNGAVCLPKTGQTTSYYPGDDGDLQKGVSCPVQRFTDNGDGTITDNLTGLMWEKASSTTVYNWNDAFTRITSLNLSKLAGHIDWRLPNRKEIISLINFECLDPLLQGFTGISEGYWTSNSYAENSYYAWWGSIKWISVDSVITNGKNNVFYVIGVRGG